VAEFELPKRAGASPLFRPLAAQKVVGALPPLTAIRGQGQGPFLLRGGSMSLRIWSGRGFPTEERLQRNYFCFSATQISLQTLNSYIEGVISCESKIVLSERDAKCLVHRGVHRAVHLSGQRNFREKRSMRKTQRVSLYVPKALNWAGATPLSLPRKPWRSLQPRQL
jgi:hypothetical protein